MSQHLGDAVPSLCCCGGSFQMNWRTVASIVKCSLTEPLMMPIVLFFCVTCLFVAPFPRLLNEITEHLHLRDGDFNDNIAHPLVYLE